jgi:hypothetical protein
MEKSTWWIGLSNEWKVIHRTSWKEPRPDINPAVHLWIKKQETDKLIRTPNMKGEMVYEYSIWNNSFRKRELFPIQKWSIVGLTTPTEWKLSKKIYLHLQDPQKVVKSLLIDSDNNWNLSKAFTKIDYRICIFDSWDDYENQKS